ncbi:MAG TPA: amidohydrolase family protein [Thermoanaerobaculia bacterium]|nr:amidohydrolase family protein [Thermoanaerobaculia bacterium]
MSKTLSFLVLFLMPLPSAGPNQNIQPKYLVLTHVAVIDATGAPLKPDMTVLIEDDHIARLGKKVRAPAGAKVVDATGKFLIPGLWDMHVHSLYEGRPELLFPMFIANGVTGVREMASTLPLEQIAVLRKRIERGEVLGPRFGAVAGKILESPAAQLGPDFEPVSSADEGRQIVRSRKQQGADFVKVYNQLPRDVYFAIADEARRQHIPFAGHLPFSVSAVEASDAGQRSIEHLTRLLTACSGREAEILRGLTDTGKSVVAARAAGFRAEAEAAESYDPRKASALFLRFHENETWQCPTLVQLRRFALVEDAGLANDERLKFIPLSVRERWRSSLAGPLAENAPYLKRSFPKQVEMVGAMRAARVPVLAGTDSGWGNPYTFAGFSLHDELALLNRAGLSPMETLQSATLNPARFLGLQDKLGTVEAGKIADLVLLEANPLDDVTNTRKIAAVVVNGRYMSKAELQKTLSDVETAAGKK